MKNIIVSILVILFFAGILTLALRGIAGNPTQTALNQNKWTVNGPFELSPDRGRFALAYSLVENHSFYFSLPLAKFVTPDLGYKNQHYVSLFAPGVSFAIIPGYIIGKYFNASQLGSVAIIALFAIVNAFLIRLIAIRLGANSIAATLGAITFLFASPAFSYGVSLYEHHVSTFLILLSLYVLLHFKGLWSLAFIWFLCALSIPVDYPNLFLMMPIGLYALGRIIYIKHEKSGIKIRIKLLGILTFLTILLPLAFFLWFNKESYGNPLQFSGTVASVQSIGSNGKPVIPKKTNANNAGVYPNPSSQQKSSILFFNSRYLLNGLDIELFSSERGVIWYTPVMILGILGAMILYRKNQNFLTVLVGIVGVDVVLYALFGDPWGGWAFGARYLIPAYAIMAIFLARALSDKNKNVIFLVLFTILFMYSVSLNTLGALTSNSIPNQDNFSIDINFLMKNQSKSFVWQTYFRNSFSAKEYYGLLVALILVPSLGMIVVLPFLEKEKKYVG